MSRSFIRIKLIEVKLSNSGNLFTHEPFAAVSVKEKEFKIDGTAEYAQKKKTFYPQWGRCFDSHIHDGRRIQIIIMDGPENALLEVTVELLMLADHYRSDMSGNAVKLALDLIPTGQLIMQVKVYGDKGDEDVFSESNPIPFTEDLPKNATALRGRRGAIKFGNVNEVQCHQFFKKIFRQPAYCSLCHELMWGFSKEGWQCKLCAYVAHRRCLDLILTKCPKATNRSQATMFLKERFKLDVPHRFVIHSYSSPNFCELCGQILWGLFRQGLQCEVCGVNCHRRCKAAMPNLCGVNQKLLAEALLDIKSQKNSKSKDSSTNAVINVTKTGAFEERRANMPLPAKWVVDST